MRRGALLADAGERSNTGVGLPIPTGADKPRPYIGRRINAPTSE